MAMTLVVMAAGRGSRFGGMKQVAGIGPSGESLFDYAVYDAIRAGFDDALFIVSDESQGPVAEHVANGCGRHVNVRYVVQAVGEGRKKPWGTGHAVLSACEQVDGPFGVVNADDFYGQRSYGLLAAELAAEHGDHILVGFRLRESLSENGGVSRGLCEVEDGFLRSITELHDVQAVDGRITSREVESLTGDELISANLWGFAPSFCAILDREFEAFLTTARNDPDAEFLIGDALTTAVKNGEAKVRVVPTPERFLGITYVADVGEVTNQIAALVTAARYPSPLWH